MQDLLKMLPHSKKDAKFDMRDGLPAINEVDEHVDVVSGPVSTRCFTVQVAEMKNCDCTMMLECRKKSDVYLW